MSDERVAVFSCIVNAIRNAWPIAPRGAYREIAYWVVELD